MSPSKALTVIVPAFNEEQYLRPTLAAIADAIGGLPPNWIGQIVVVDDQSDDGTAEVAAAFEATVLRGSHTGIGAARNLGAFATTSNLVVFVDADTIVPSHLLATVVEQYERHKVRAISVPSAYVTDRRVLKPLLAWWRWYAPRHNSTQGLFQAFDRELFADLDGYNESLQMAEDTDLFDRAIKRLPDNGWAIMTDSLVQTSMRRYEQQNAVALWMLTNPITTRHLRRYRRLWRRWYENPPR